MDSENKAMVILAAIIFIFASTIVYFIFQSSSEDKQLKKVCIESIKTNIPEGMSTERRELLLEHALSICMRGSMQ